MIVLLIIFTGVFSKKDTSPTAPDQNIVLSDMQKLTSSVWVWEKTQMNDDSVRLPSTAGAFTITFLSDGTLTGTTDCNGFFGQYSIKEATVTFGPFGSTMMYCDGSSEQVFMRDIESSNRVFFTEAGNLVLLLPYDSGSIIFEKKQ